MKKILLSFVLLTGCSILTPHEFKKETLQKEINILKLELRKIRLEKQINEEEKEY